MVIETDIMARVKSAARETVPLVILSSVFLVFLGIEVWSFSSVVTELARAAVMSVLASIVALAALWIGLSTAEAKQNKLMGWLVGGAFSIVMMSLVIWLFQDAKVAQQ